MAAPPRSWDLGFFVFQVMQIVLGILSAVLGGFFYIPNYTLLVTSGAAIWTGAVVSRAGLCLTACEKCGALLS